MSVAESEVPRVEVRPPVPVYRFSVQEYHRLGELGVLAGDDRVELLQGWITPKMIHNPRHDATIAIIAEALQQYLPPGWCIRIQSAITTADSEPEPDLAVVRGHVRSYVEGHPQPKDIGLLVEVADASLERDRGLKACLYANAGIPIYWIVNLVDLQIEVHGDPSGAVPSPSYPKRRVYAPGDEFPLLLDDQQITVLRVADLLP